MPDLPGPEGGPARRPSGELEASVLAALWAAGRALTAADVQRDLGTDLARTTVTTILARLYEKGSVSRTRAGRGYAYLPVQDSPGLAARRMRTELDKSASDDRGTVLARFVSELNPSDEALLRELLRAAGASGEGAGPFGSGSAAGAGAASAGAGFSGSGFSGAGAAAGGAGFSGAGAAGGGGASAGRPGSAGGAGSPGAGAAGGGAGSSGAGAAGGGAGAGSSAPLPPTQRPTGGVGPTTLGGTATREETGA
jgi:predicted transcriptional regulator